MLRQTLRSALSPIPRAVRTLGASPSPAVLFAASEQGAWYDPADFSTLYQDSAGTTPVTAVGQPVGLLLDKRLGSVRGPELLGAWVANANWSVAGGALTCTGGASIANTTAAVPIGVFYEVTYSITAVTTAGTGISIGLGGLSSVVRNSVGSYREILQASGAGNIVITTRGDGLWRGTVDNVSLRAITGNHATQATAASRPVLSARVNRLLSTHSYAGASWTKRGAVTVGGPAPDGTGELLSNVGTAAVDDIFQMVVSGAEGPAHTPRLEIWPVTTVGTLGINNPAGGAYGRWFVDLSKLTAGAWNEITTNHPAVTVSAAFVAAPAGNVGHHYLSAAGVLSFYARYPDVRTAADAALAIPAYQRVNSATDYDTAGFPHYLSFDGTDDGMATGSIDFTATDKMTVIAGVHKTSDAATAILAELSADLNANPGTFYLTAPPSTVNAGFSFNSKGTSPSGIASPSGQHVAPTSKVVSAQASISTDSCVIRVNGVQAGSSGSDQAFGNYGNYPLYIGRRGGTTLPFNGRLYSLIVRGATTDATTLARIERFVGSRMGIAL